MQIDRANWREAVRAQGLTLDGLARLTGASVRAVYSYSSGARNPSDEWIERVAAVLEQLRAMAEKGGE